MNPRKKVKHISLKSLKTKAWKLQSEYIRRTEKKCFTCGATPNWKLLQAGHYIHGDNMDFEFNNIHAQCVRCNKWLHGNSGIYAEKLIKLLGEEEVSLLRFKSGQSRKYNITELEQLIETYTEAIKCLNDRDTIINQQIDFRVLSNH